MRIEFTIPMLVVPKQSIRGGVAFGSGRRNFFQPKKVRENARALAAYAQGHRPAAPLTGPIRVYYSFHYPYLKRHTKSQRAGPMPKDTEPDVDQLAKQLSDVLESCGFFVNDARISQLTITKWWTDTAEPCVHIEIEDRCGENCGSPGRRVECCDHENPM